MKRKRRTEKGREEENLREWDGRDGGRTQRASNKRDILIDGIVMRLA